MGVRRTISRQELPSFRALYQAHYGFVWATVRRHGVRSEAIEDAVQDAFLTAFRRWDDAPGDRARAWLYGIARRVSSNARRSQRRRDRKHEVLRCGEAPVHDDRGRLEASALLEGFVSRLEPEDRELFVLGVVEGLTGAELSAALGARPSTLYGRLDALRRRFRAEAGVRGPAALRRVRHDRPAATAAGWALLAPQLGGSAALGLSLGGLKVAALGVAGGERGPGGRGEGERPTRTPCGGPDRSIHRAPGRRTTTGARGPRGPHGGGPRRGVDAPGRGRAAHTRATAPATGVFTAVADRPPPGRAHGRDGPGRSASSSGVFGGHGVGDAVGPRPCGAVPRRRLE